MGDLSLSLVSIDEVSPLANRSAWLERRHTTSGASETPIILRFTGSLLKLYLEKRWLLEPEPPTEEQLWGLKLEPLIAEAYTEKTGRVIVRQQAFSVHPEFPWMSATIDCLTDKEDIVELKAIGNNFRLAQQLGDSENNESLPDSWVAQAEQQMMVLDRPVAFFGVFGPGLRLRHYTLKRHAGLDDIIQKQVDDWWHNQILAEVPPEDYVAEDAVTLAKAFRKQTGEWLSLGPELLNSAQKFEQIKAEIKRLEDLRDVEKARLLGALGNCAGADLPGGWSLHRKVLEVNYKAREAHTDSQVRFSVKEPKQDRF